MIKFDEIIKICRKHGADFTENAPLSAFTAFKIGGPCRLLVKANSCELIKEISLFCRKDNLPLRVIGKGSNLLVSDAGFKGVVLLLGSDFAEISVRGDIIKCEAGASLTAFCSFARDNSLAGAEFVYGIPGSVGGAVIMNAGAYDGEIADIFHSCDYFDENCEIKTLTRENAEFSYRKSPFTGTKSIILSAEFKLAKGDKTQINAKMEDLMSRRREKQPLEFPSAGSTFKRPDGDYASRLVDACGLKGFSVGGAQVSEKHAGFIINKGNATCDDVLKLIEAVSERVYKETGIILEREVELL